MQQSAPQGREWIERTLGRLTGRRVAVIPNRNKRTLVYYRFLDGRQLEVRMNRALLDAPLPIVESLADWILRRGDRGAALDRFLEDRRDHIRSQIRPPRIRTRGKVHDLEAIFRELLANHFRQARGRAEDQRPPRPDCRVSWGTGSRHPKRRARSIRFGSFDPILRLVRLHPRLDRPDVPRRFVAFVLYHELLHAALPANRDAAGRLCHHSPQFRHYERLYPDYCWARCWEEENLVRLITPS